MRRGSKYTNQHPPLRGYPRGYPKEPTRFLPTAFWLTLLCFGSTLVTLVGVLMIHLLHVW